MTCLVSASTSPPCLSAQHNTAHQLSANHHRLHNAQRSNGRVEGGHTRHHTPRQARHNARHSVPRCGCGAVSSHTRNAARLPI